jgi:hypothetical protein
MREKGKDQLSLGLPVSPQRDAIPVTKTSPNSSSLADTMRSSGAIISYAENKASKDRREAAKHFGRILQLVRHFK